MELHGQGLESDSVSPVFSHQSFDLIRRARSLEEVVSPGETVVTCKVVFVQKLVQLLARSDTWRGKIRAVVGRSVNPCAGADTGITH